jgi:hypothetical protein
MLPILVNLGPVKIYSMGVCLVIGLFLSLYFWWKMGRDEHFDEIALFDGYFLSLITFLIAGRLGYVLTHASDLGTFYRSIALLAYPGINILAQFCSPGRTDGMSGDSSSNGVDSLIFGGLGGLLNNSKLGTNLPWPRNAESTARYPDDCVVGDYFWGRVTGAEKFSLLLLVQRRI